MIASRRVKRGLVLATAMNTRLAASGCPAPNCLPPVAMGGSASYRDYGGHARPRPVPLLATPVCGPSRPLEKRLAMLSRVRGGYRPRQQALDLAPPARHLSTANDKEEQKEPASEWVMAVMVTMT